MATIDIYDKGQVDVLLSAKANTADLPSAAELVPDYSGAAADDVLTIENGAPVWKAAGGSGGEDYDVIVSDEPIAVSGVTATGSSATTGQLRILTRGQMPIQINGKKIMSRLVLGYGYSPNVSFSGCTARFGTITSASIINEILSRITVKSDFSGGLSIQAVQISSGLTSGVICGTGNATQLTYQDGVLTNTPSSINLIGLHSTSASYAVQQIIVYVQGA